MPDHESLESFARSFSYGTRTDLNFKFLARRSEEEVGEIIRRILEETGRILDEGDPARLIDLFIEAQRAAYATRPLDERFTYADAPFHVPQAPVSQSKVVLLTSSGHFAAGDDPEPFGVKGMTQEQAMERIGEFLRAEPVLSAVPIDVPPEETVVRHGGYDVRGAAADRNVAFPIDRLRRLAGAGEIGDLHPEAYSFVGAAAQTRIRRVSAPAWAEMLQAFDVDVALLVPL